MIFGGLVRRFVAAVIVVGAIVSFAAGARASETAREAGIHFRRGVELYNEANYSAALVEFKRAYALASSSTALYDIGETQFQLQDYAGALQTFRTFLAQFGPNESHHAEVEANLPILAARVGHLRVTTAPEGAELAVDDEAVGKTPLAEPVVVSVGRRKVVASLAGREPVTRYVDVAAGDDTAVTLSFPAPVESPVAPPPLEQPLVVRARAPLFHISPELRIAGWVATGALAAAAGTFGVLAVHESDELRQERSGLTTHAALAHDANLTAVFGALADSLGVAAVVAGGISLYWTLSSPPFARGSATPTTRVGIGPASIRFETIF